MDENEVKNIHTLCAYMYGQNFEIQQLLLQINSIVKLVGVNSYLWVSPLCFSVFHIYYIHQLILNNKGEGEREGGRPREGGSEGGREGGGGGSDSVSWITIPCIIVSSP